MTQVSSANFSHFFANYCEVVCFCRVFMTI